MKLLHAIATSLAALLIVGAVFAQNGPDQPFRVAQPHDYTREGSQAGGTLTPMASSANTYCILHEAGGRCAVFAWDSTTFVSMPVAFRCTLSQYPGTTLGDGANGLVATTAAGSGPALSSVVLSANGGGFTLFPALANFRAADPLPSVGGDRFQHLRSGGASYPQGRYCNATVEAFGGDAVYPPCESDGQCQSEYGLAAGVTCSRSVGSGGGALAFCKSDGESQTLGAEIKR